MYLTHRNSPPELARCLRRFRTNRSTDTPPAPRRRTPYRLPRGCAPELAAGEVYEEVKLRAGSRLVTPHTPVTRRIKTQAFFITAVDNLPKRLFLQNDDDRLTVSHFLWTCGFPADRAAWRRCHAGRASASARGSGLDRGAPSRHGYPAISSGWERANVWPFGVCRADLGVEFDGGVTAAGSEYL